jgi:hypothetical protein
VCVCVCVWCYFHLVQSSSSLISHLDAFFINHSSSFRVLSLPPSLPVATLPTHPLWETKEPSPAST